MATNKKPTPAPKAMEVQKVTTATAVAVPADIDFAEDSRFGLEDVETGDFAIPRLKIAQDITAATKPREADYIAGLEVGMIFDPVSGKYWDAANGKPVKLVLVHYAKSYAEFLPKNKGFVKSHGSDPTAFNTAKFVKGEGFMLPNGNEIIPSMDFYAFVVNEDGTTSQCLVSFAKTNTPEGKRLVTLASSLKIEVPDAAKPGATKRITPALFYRSYDFSTVVKTAEKNSWFGFKVTPAQAVVELPEGESIYKDARVWRQLIVEGKVKVAAPHSDEAPVGAADESAPM